MMNELPITYDGVKTIRAAGVRAYQLSVTTHRAKLAECQTKFDDFCSDVLEDNTAIITPVHPIMNPPGLLEDPLALFP